MLLVTGITGHTGCWLIKKMQEEKYDRIIKCVVREKSDTKLLDDSGLNIVKAVGDINDSVFLNSCMKDVDTILHIAGIQYSENIVKAAVNNGVEWIICVHTTGRYSKYKSASAEYIRIEDGILTKYGDQVNFTIVRPTMIYGSSKDRNMYKLVDYLYRHKLFPVFGKGLNLMQPVHAKDLGEAYYHILVNKEVTAGKQYNLSGKEPIMYIDLLKTVSEALGRKNIFIHIPMGFSIFAARIYNALFRKALVSVEQVMRMNEDKAFSYENATRDFGYSPLSFEEGIKLEVEEYLRNVE
jgi:nucleoside-diphosphate-sugar epimerase